MISLSRLPTSPNTGPGLDRVHAEQGRQVWSLTGRIQADHQLHQPFCRQRVTRPDTPDPNRAMQQYQGDRTPNGRNDRQAISQAQRPSVVGQFDLRAATANRQNL